MEFMNRVKSRYRYSFILLRQLVITDFKLRYQGSVLGYFWSLLKPLFLFVILYIVFVKFLKIGDDIPHAPVYLLGGIVLWNFFAEVTNSSVKAIVERTELIRKINFPKYNIILASCTSAFINLLLNLVVIAVFMAFNHVPATLHLLWMFPLVAELFIFALSASFILSALYVKLRDVNYIWEILMQALFYLTPVIYPLSLVSDRWPGAAKLLLINPMAQIIQDARHEAVTPVSQTAYTLGGAKLLVLPVLVALLVMVTAIIYFKKRSPYFAEEV